MLQSYKFTAFALSESLPHQMQNSQVDYVIFAFIFINWKIKLVEYDRGKLCFWYLSNVLEGLLNIAK